MRRKWARIRKKQFLKSEIEWCQHQIRREKTYRESGNRFSVQLILCLTRSISKLQREVENLWVKQNQKLK